jgi:hypothetical protein
MSRHPSAIVEDKDDEEDGGLAMVVTDDDQGDSPRLTETAFLLRTREARSNGRALVSAEDDVGLIPDPKCPEDGVHFRRRRARDRRLERARKGWSKARLARVMAQLVIVPGVCLYFARS